MTVDLFQIPWDEIKPNGLLVVRAAPGRSLGEPAYMEQIDRFVYEVRDRVGDSVKVLVMEHETEVFNVPEKLMNQMGWVRKP